MLDMISDIAVTIRPALAAMSRAATGAATAIPTAGRFVSTSIIAADTGTIPRNTVRAPRRSTSRPTSGVLTSVSTPPAMYTTGSCLAVTPALATNAVLMKGITENAPTIRTAIRARARRWAGAESVSTRWAIGCRRMPSVCAAMGGSTHAVIKTRGSPNAARV